MTPRISVIIPSYNRPLELTHCLDSLHAESVTDLVQYIVQDDASTEPVYVPASLAEPYKNPTNLGFAANCHAGASHAKGDILLFVNQDAYLEKDAPGWDARLIEFFDSVQPEAAAAGVKILTQGGHIQHAGIVFDAACQPTHRFIGYADPEYPPANRHERVKAVTGAVFAIRRDIWRQYRGFDSHAFPGGYFEDVDLCLRLGQVGGKQIWYIPSIVFRHRGGTSGIGKNLQANAQRFKQRWVDSGMLTPDLPTVVEGYWA